MSISSKGPATIPSVLTIAGTDSSGGAGVLADIKTITALGCYGSAAITALTAQNTTGVTRITYLSNLQLTAIFDDIPVQAIKTGMLHDSSVIEVVVKELIARRRALGGVFPPIVVDPVMVSTSGHTLLQVDAVAALCAEMLPLATLITPNIPEAELILKQLTGSAVKEDIRSISGMITAAEKISNACSKASVLVKGGHLELKISDILATRDVGLLPTDHLHWYQQCGPDEPEILRLARAGSIERNTDERVVADVLWTGGKGHLFIRALVESKSTHGTGCTLAAAIACELAKGVTMEKAVEIAANYTHQAIATAVPMGRGHGPLNHLHASTTRVLPSPTITCPAPFISTLIRSTKELWNAYVQHEFVVQLGKGILPQANFVHFIKQDYHYLKHYARAYGLLAAKSSTFLALESCARTIAHVVRETGMHVAYCQTFGVTENELLNTQESAALSGYTTYILEAGLRGDDLTLLVALLACLLGYGEVGLWLKRNALIPDSGFYAEGNPYEKWINDYSGNDYQTAVRIGIETLEDRISQDPPSVAKYTELLHVWERVVKLEIAFWDMAMALS
ncbi:hypothetical protein FS837_002348 [Tulasnella sp. UAMH 9824]|nr:hypothetical protein FS837_002348 [Tulasnella sp. UAMH 9824]